MGVSSSSRIADLDSNQSLNRLVGNERIEKGAPFWDELLSFYFTAPENRGDAKVLEDATRNLCKRMAKNNPATGNFTTLIQIFIERSGHLATDKPIQQDNVYNWKVYNSIFLIRSLVKFFTENLSEDQVNVQFASPVSAHQLTEEAGSISTEATTVGDQAQSVLVNGEASAETTQRLSVGIPVAVPSRTADSVAGAVEASQAELSSETGLAPLLGSFLDSLIASISDVPVLPFTYGIKVEVINTLLVFLSRQLRSYVSSDVSLVLQHVLSINSRQSAAVVRSLLVNFIHRDLAPPHDLWIAQAGFFTSISTAASNLWSYVVGSNPQVSEHRETPLADQSLLLFLVLTNHLTHKEGQMVNPYRRAMRCFADLRGQVNQQDTDVSFVLQLDQLYFALCQDLKQDQAILLLYMLLHENANMAAFIFSRSDIENLILPILKLLYSAEKRNSHLVYMALIVLLMFSQDDNFNKSIHEIS
jgi:hypothetical protein